MARTRRRLRSDGKRAALPLLAAAMLAGCSAQGTTDYQGDPLFTMTGRVELQLNAATPDLVPTLAFMAPEGSEIRFIDAEVSGEFPASFRVDLYTPPPASVVNGFEYQDIPGEPRHSLGYISAVTPDRLPVLYYAVALGGEGESCDASGCTLTWEAKNFDASRRGTVTTRCPPPTEPGGPAPIDLDTEYAGRSSLATFLYSAVTNACLNRIRNRRTRERRVASNPPPRAATPLDAEQQLDLHSALRDLPDEVAQVAIYYYMDALTQDEIAQIIGCSRRKSARSSPDSRAILLERSCPHAARRSNRVPDRSGLRSLVRARVPATASGTARSPRERLHALPAAPRILRT
jgi:hypothetical protein